MLRLGLRVWCLGVYGFRQCRDAHKGFCTASSQWFREESIVTAYIARSVSFKDLMILN